MWITSFLTMTMVNIIYMFFHKPAGFITVNSKVCIFLYSYFIMLFYIIVYCCLK